MLGQGDILITPLSVQDAPNREALDLLLPHLDGAAEELERLVYPNHVEVNPAVPLASRDHPGLRQLAHEPRQPNKLKATGIASIGALDHGAAGLVIHPVKETFSVHEDQIHPGIIVDGIP